MTATLAHIIHDIGDAPAATYSKVVIIALIATAIVLVVHLLVSLGRGSRTMRPRWGLLTRLIYFGAVITVFALGVTSLYSVLAHGAMHGWFLFVHLFAAGGFVVFFLLLAVMWAMPSRFFIVEPIGQDDGRDEPPPAARFHHITRLAFWIILVSGVITAGTMLISMLPVLGTQAMSQMITVHRYAGLVLVVATIIHLYTVLLARMGRL